MIPLDTGVMSPKAFLYLLFSICLAAWGGPKSQLFDIGASVTAPLDDRLVPDGLEPQNFLKSGTRLSNQ